MAERHGILDYATMKWGLFALLFLLAPAPVIVFRDFMTGPVVFVAASLVSLIYEALVPGGASGVEIIGYFAVHLAIYLFLYGVGASAIAKALTRIADRRARGGMFAAVSLAAAALPVLPIYGGAGLHGGAFGPIAFFFAKLNESHFGPNAALTVYAPAVLCLAAGGAIGLIRRHRARRGAG